MNAQQLRNSILQEAIQGRLVPQDPNDEPASALLNRIREEKKRLVKAGKLKKKDLEETPISEDEKPFDIPDSWEWVRFSHIYWQLTDGTHSTPKYTTSGIPFLSVKDMSSGVLSFSNTKYISPEEHSILSQRCHPQKGDLLLSKVGTTGVPLIIDSDIEFSIFVSLALIKFFPDLIDSRFLLYLINSPLVQLQAAENTRGVGNKNWVLKAISDTIMVLPPLAEQKRIVAKIEELMPKVEEYGKAQEELDKLNEELPERLKKSVLQEAISGKLVPQDPNDEPVSVLVERIREEKKQLVKEGKLKKKDLEETPISEDEILFDIPDSWGIAKLSLITSLIDGEKREGNFVCLDAKFLRGKSTGDILSKGKYVKQGDNIILVDGENSGEVFTVPCEGYMGSTFKQLWTSECVYLPYVLYFIQYYKDILRNSKKGAAIPHLNKDIFYNLIIGIPPLAEQKRIVAKIEQLLHEIDKLKV